MTASERRNAILEVLCFRRFDTVANLAFEFGVTDRTIRNDILTLSLEYPIYTTKGNGGGIHDQRQRRRYSCRRKVQARKDLSQGRAAGIVGKALDLSRRERRRSNEVHNQDFRIERSNEMKRKTAAEYVVEVNGTPDYAKIPKPVLESVAKKFLENILKQQKEKDEG